jgi:hypothetical protein
MADNDHVNPEDEAAALEALIREHYEHEIEACEELADFSENALTPWGGRTIKKADSFEAPCGIALPLISKIAGISFPSAFPLELSASALGLRKPRSEPKRKPFKPKVASSILSGRIPLPSRWCRHSRSPARSPLRKGDCQPGSHFARFASKGLTFGLTLA